MADVKWLVKKTSVEGHTKLLDPYKSSLFYLEPHLAWPH